MTTLTETTDHDTVAWRTALGKYVNQHGGCVPVNRWMAEEIERDIRAAPR